MRILCGISLNAFQWSVVWNSMGPRERTKMKVRIRNFTKIAILDPALSEGVLWNHPCQWVYRLVICSGSQLSLVRMSLKLTHHKGTKVTEPNIWKNLRGSQLGEKSHFFGHFWYFLSISLHPVIRIFWNFIYIISSTLSNT